MLLLLTLACKAEFAEGDTAILPTGLTPNYEVLSIFPESAYEYGNEGICVVGRGFEGDFSVTVGDEPCELDTVRAYDLDPSSEAWYSDHLSCNLPLAHVGTPTRVPVEVRRGDEPPKITQFTYEAVPEVDGVEVRPAQTQACCTLDYPSSFTVAAGQVSDVIQARMDPPGNESSLTLELGWGPQGSHPDDGCWRWAAAANQGAGSFPGESVFQGTLQAPPWPGEYVVAARASIDGGLSWQVCDLGAYSESCHEGGGSLTDYSEANAARMTVE